jgi:pullulanase/glycogen debranching enzyme
MPNRLAGARWESRTSGIVALARDWDRPGSPPLSLPPPAALTLLEPADPRVHARWAGHWIEGDEVHFFLWDALVPDLGDRPVRVVGPFNDWGNAGDPAAWVLHAVCVAGADGFLCVARLADVLPRGGVTTFKFRLADGRWVEPPHDADNIQRDWQGHRNLVLDRHRAGRHLFRFVADGADVLAAPQRLVWDDGTRRETCEILACGPLDQLRPPGRLGAFAAAGRTTFRLFAPRATAVRVAWSAAGSDASPRPGQLDLRPEGQGAWSGVVDLDLAGAAYAYQLEPGERTLPDPWARHAARNGDQLVTHVASADEAPVDDGFSPPRPQDLVILEAHLRDLLALRGDAARAGFRDLADWVRRDGAYLRSLGVNALELLPCADYERGPDPAEYHWGYMPVSAFAPASAYAPGGGRSPAADFRDLVAACHQAGLAVIVDLVLNHFGSPNTLLALDPDYWFRRDASGALSNLSGCGNDFRAESPVGARLAADAVLHWLTVLGADGVRLDLAELLGVAVLRDIEAEVRALAPGKILIAEPWSFRGHVGPELDRTSWTSWDDGFREFLPAFVRGHVRAADLLHQMAGLGIRPSARLRYLQSHDDHAWIDRITERPGGDGSEPAPADLLRTRLGHLVLLASAGVPMLAAGQDFLHSKRGVGNTWRRGDLNALDPARLARFASEHAFVATLVRFRLSEAGAPLRPHAAVSPGWMRAAFADGAEAFAAELNADGALGPARVLVAANPHPWVVRLPLAPKGWKPVVLSPCAECPHAPGSPPSWEGDTLVLPPLGCGLWSR